MEETDFSPSSWLTSQRSKLWDFASTDFEVLVSSSSWRELVCFSVSGGLSESTLEFNCSSSSKVSCFCCSCNSCQIQWSDYNTDEWDQGAVMGGRPFCWGVMFKILIGLWGHFQIREHYKYLRGGGGGVILTNFMKVVQSSINEHPSGIERNSR